MQNTLQKNPRSISAHNLFADKGFGATAGNHTDAILSVLLGARTSTSLWLSSFLTGAGKGIPPRPGAPAPRRTALPPPGLLLRHFLRQNIIFRRHRLAFGSWTFFLCLCSWHHQTCHTRNLWLHLCCGIASPKPGTDKRLGPNHHTKEGGWLWLNHHPCFSTSKTSKKSTGIYLILFCPKFPQRYFAKIS